MPYKPKRPCRQNGCKNLTDDSTGYCQEHRGAYLKAQDSLRDSANDRGYTYRWHKASRRYLRIHPLCVECLKENRTTAATVVDHIIPHRGSLEFFWDESNWQSLCDYHHNQKTARERQTS
jgi:5-methylcytosine-specific restriction protein A